MSLLCEYGLADEIKMVNKRPDNEKLLRKKVDVVLKSGIRPELKKGILKEVVYI